MSSGNSLRALVGVLAFGAFVYFTFFSAGYGKKVTQGSIEVYYKDGATKEEAERLAAHLAKLWAEAVETRSVQLVKVQDKHHFRMVVKKEFQNDNTMLAQLGIVGARISRDVLNGSELVVEACDDHLKVIRPVLVPIDFRHGILKGKIEVFHAAAVSKEDAEKFLAFAAKEFESAPAPLITFAIGKSDAGRVVSMAFKTELLKQPGVNAELQAFRAKISKTVFDGEPVVLATCDDSFNVTETFKP